MFRYGFKNDFLCPCKNHTYEVHVCACYLALRHIIFQLVGEEEEETVLVPVQTVERDFNCKELKLRPYQNKLCENALNGENVIICAPTGSGKTFVATKIIMEHFNSRARRGICKVAFLVNQVALAEQQSRVLKEYLNQRIEIMTGDTQSTDRVTLAKLLPITDIIVMTAQIFVDAITEKEIEDVTLFSLIIFDECHHTKARHPYNQLMNRYIDLKLKKSGGTPRIVGLTASLGVGKASAVKGAVDHIVSLCANLDVSMICTPDEGAADDMAKYVNTPITRFKRAPGRKNDLFHKTVAEIMNDIEKDMKESPCKFCVNHIILFFAPIQSDSFYENVDQIYNSALIINNDCRSKDSLQYIEDELKKKITPNQSTDARQKLMTYFESRQKRLHDLSKNNTNPKLEKLKEMIIEAFEMNPDSRAIVFAKTLSLVQKLKNWIQETPDLSNLNLNPETVTGARASSDQGGMTKNRQLEVLECFKEGSGKLIIATSVAEEGLDIQKCNLVIRYDHVTNEIAMVQSRGRARAENSQFMVVTADDSKSEKKEQMNLSRELMMRQAILKISELEQSTLAQMVLSHQNKAQIVRDSEKRVRHGRIIDDSEFELRCFQCNTLACFSSDIRTIKHSSYTVLSDNFNNSYKTRDHPDPVEFKAGFMKKYKICCKEKDCRHDWGIIAIYLNTEFPLIKIESFVIEDSNGKKTTVKKWKSVPFQIPEMSDDDLRRRLADSSGNRSDDDSGDDLN
ncbi:hypothetical protein LOTGIDRAFT_211354 [Lottia gigantea]|uniref:RNA helicase n=1 Tax=Lottia gigantea TaxID=225164 RepID=V3ZF34_LOTGI|nr:hypothetical protein LOTGIDRAFT_211354 [Lottia gigantea]ESO82722.1 hypothetical protein LOTGIDRAFT_211354 [Lottia gigantea]